MQPPGFAGKDPWICGRDTRRSNDTMTTARVWRGFRGHGGGMDLLEAKSRIAEALVESIFRRARYQVEAYPAGRTPLRFGREDFSPDFSAAIPGEYGVSSHDILIEVKYRPSVEQ